MTPEKMVQIAENLPGYYGYKPCMKNNRLEIEELEFRLFDEENDYTVKMTLEEQKPKEINIWIRYDDGSIAKVNDTDTEYKKVLSFKEKLNIIFSK